MRRILLVPALVMTLVVPGRGGAQGLYDLLENAQEALDQTIRQATDGEQELAYKLVSREQFQVLLRDAQSVLQGGDLEQIASWLPTGEALLLGLDAVPGFEPHADWLRQRIDYFAIAEQAVSSAPVPKSSVQPKQQPPPKQLPPPKQQQQTIPRKPAPKPVLPPPPSVVAALAKRDAIAGSSQAWAKRLEGRQVPKRSAELVPALKEIFKDAGIPPELVWMAEVESTFNPQARSPSGAAGLFQLMPATARHLGLKLKPSDQRMNPTHNGRAAAKYLAYLQGRFDDWPLAIAAYNGGEGRVAKLLKQEQAEAFEEIAGKLPGETRMYVPKVLATIELREGIDASLLGRG